MSLTKAWSLTVILAVAAAIAPRGAFAQVGSSTAMCMSSFDWMNNSLSQNPCLVGSYLASECFNGTLTVDPLANGTQYSGPNFNIANDCLCSTVTYSMFGACGICQNSISQSWSVWSFDCSVKHYSIFPMNIPNGTAVPHWAYLDVVIDDNFNATAAQLVGDSPEATSTQVQSTSSIISSTTSVSAYLTATSTMATETSTAQSTSKSSNIGAIAGGVVGGIAGIAIVGVAAWFFVRRSRSTTVLRDSAGLENVYMTQQFRLYDPSDPSTFPTSPPSGVTLPTSSTINVYQRPPIPSHVYSEQSRSSGKYSGAPEL